MVLGIKYPVSLAQNRSLVVIITKPLFVSLVSSISVFRGTSPLESRQDFYPYISAEQIGKSSRLSSGPFEGCSRAKSIKIPAFHLTGRSTVITG